MTLTKIELKITDPKNIYTELAKALVPYRRRKKLSVEFIVEGTLKNPIVGIRYPGRKVVKRQLKSKRKNTAKWGNLLDFVVIPYENGKEVKTESFTFESMLRDFENNKRRSSKFWSLLEGIYYNNELKGTIPQLKGIDTKLFLLVLKWIWIQEDINYKFRWDEIGSPVKYVLLSKKGKPMSRGAGRAKFFGAMILLKHHFTFEEVKKIIPMYA